MKDVLLLCIITTIVVLIYKVIEIRLEFGSSSIACFFLHLYWFWLG